MNPPTAILAEDEPLLRAEIRDALRSLWPELVIESEAADGDEAMRELAALLPTSPFSIFKCPGRTVASCGARLRECARRLHHRVQ